MRRLCLLLAVVLLSAGCTLLGPPPQPVLPTPSSPEGLSEAIDYEEIEAGQAPITGVAPAMDPDILALMDAVSKQNLYAYVQTLENFGTRHPLSTTARDDYGVGAARRWIYQEFERVGDGRLDLAYHDFPFLYEGTTAPQQNVVATLPGVDSHPGVILLIAHYDSAGRDVGDPEMRAPGADNNASGVALLLEMARLLSAREWRQTIVFVALAAHEQGNFGAKNYARDIMLDGWILDAVINNDTVGGHGGIAQEVRLFAAGPEHSLHSQLARYFDFIGELYTPLFPVNVIGTVDRPGRFGDQQAFVEVGVPAVRLTESEEDADAQNTIEDTADTLDYDYLAKVVRLNIAVVATMAAAPPPPSAPAVAPMAEEGNFLLSWTPDRRAAGYAVIFRRLGSDETILRFISAEEAGNVAITGMDATTSYGISVAALDKRGRVSRFSEEVLTP